MTDQTPRKVSLDLDAQTRSESFEPFSVKIAGELVEFNDPAELDYKVLDKINDPETFARYCVADASRSHFRDQRLPVWKFRILTKDYMEHYKVEELLGN